MPLPTSPQAIVDAASTELTASYLACTTLTFALYDWFISLDEEIAVVWAFRERRKLSCAPLLYALSRYPAIVQAILIWQTVFPMSETACGINHRIQFVLAVPILLTPAIFSAIRVYALSPNSKVAAMLTFVLLCVPGLIINVMNITADSVSLPSPFNCTYRSHLSLRLAGRLSVGCRIFTIAGDLVVLLVTWHKTYTSYTGMPEGNFVGRIAPIMLYNGSTYFMIITGINIIQVVASTTSSSLQNPTGFAISPLTPVLICRFLLDLRRADRTPSAPSSPSAYPSIAFSPRSQAGRHETAPAFIVATGSEVSTDTEFAHSMDDGEDGLPGCAENEISEAHIYMRQSLANV